CAFLRTWDPGAFAPDAETKDRLASFGVFRVDLGDGKPDFVHRRTAVREWWSRQQADTAGTETALMPSLIDGCPARIARLHEPAIKGVWGAQTAGARLVSFNARAFESYGRENGDIAPVGEDQAFKYCTALNAILADPARRTGIGDATVVWWSEAP